MDAIQTETIERDGQAYRIRIYPDPDVPNPLEDRGEMGTILSFNRRHANYYPGSARDLLQAHPDAVPLSYFEHGLCHWSVAGELPPGCQCPFDSVALAGYWLPDAETLEAAKDDGGHTRIDFLLGRAREACDAYTQWCNGEVYGYEVERITTCPHCGTEQASVVDSLWGCYGLDYCRGEARAAVERMGLVTLPEAEKPVPSVAQILADPKAYLPEQGDGHGPEHGNGNGRKR